MVQFQAAPDTPVVLIGTRADMVRSSSGAAYGDIWMTVDALLDTGRPHHCRRYPSATHIACSALLSSATTATDESCSSTALPPPPPPPPTSGTCQPGVCCCNIGSARSNCILCCRCDPAVSGHVVIARRLYSKSRAGGLGFVEVPPPPPPSATAPSVFSATSGANGHATYSAAADEMPTGGACRATLQMSSSSSSTSGARFPHVVGYFEIDSRTRKDCKSGVHHGIEQLRTSLARLATGHGVHLCSAAAPASSGGTVAGINPLPSTVAVNSRATGSGGGIYRIPRSWVAMLRILSDVSRHRASAPSPSAAAAWVPPSIAAPFVVVEDLRTLARKCDIPASQVGGSQLHDLVHQQ
jgi:hypothetical protein